MHHEIKVLSGLSAVRIRPHMYVGGDTGLDLLLGALQALSESPDRNNVKVPKKVHIQFLSDGAYRLTCDSLLLPTTSRKIQNFEQPVALSILLSLHVPGWGFWGYLPILNALSEHMRISVAEEGRKTTFFETSRGGLVEPISALNFPKGPDRSCLEFLPDRSLLRVQERDREAVFEVPEALEKIQKDPNFPFEVTCEGVSGKLGVITTLGSYTDDQNT